MLLNTKPIINKLIATAVAVGLAGLSMTSHSSHAQEPSGLLGGRTLGGAFHWSDEQVFRDWRIQRHALVGHVRLIDPDNRRHAVGNYETCVEALRRTKAQLEPLPKHVVIVTHGLGASREFMQPLADFLESEGGYHVVNYGYASTFKSIEESAESFRRMLENLDGVQSVDFVAHSLGNLIIRRTLHDLSQARQSSANSLKFRHFVMVSPPNHGAEAASKFQKQAMLKTLSDVLAGPVVEELDPERGWLTTKKSLVVPDFPFGIIIGGTGTDRGFLEVIEGDDDGLLSPETQKLAGAVDTVQIIGIHQMMPRIKAVQEKSLKFLNTGEF